jgi:hypothetical protein
MIFQHYNRLSNITQKIRQKIINLKKSLNRLHIVILKNSRDEFIHFIPIVINLYLLKRC